QSAAVSAQANLSSAQAKLQQTLAGPTSADVAAAQSALTQAQNALSLKQNPYTDADILAQEQAIKQAEANLQSVTSPATNADVVAAQQAVVTAQANLSTTLSGSKPSEILSAQASVQQAEANLASAQNDLGQAVVTAPFDGVVSAVGMSAGGSTGTNSTITLVDPNNLQVTATIGETDIARVQLGQTANVTFEALGTTPFKVTVAAIAPTGSTTQGVVGYQVTIALSNPTGVRPGMTATAQIVSDQHDDVVLIPNKALARSGSTRTVQVVTAAGTESRTVQVGLANDQNTEVTSGLDEGETVVVLSTTTSARASVPGATASSATGITGLTGGGGGAASGPPAGVP